jgi:transcriptional regulator with XRE-family HTH domain
VNAGNQAPSRSDQPRRPFVRGGTAWQPPSPAVLPARRSLCHNPCQYGCRVTESDWPSHLAAAAKAAGYTRQADLCRDTGIGDSVISKWLKGTAQPSIPQLRRVSGALRVPVLQLAAAVGHFTAKEAQLGTSSSPSRRPATRLSGKSRQPDTRPRSRRCR